MRTNDSLKYVKHAGHSHDAKCEQMGMFDSHEMTTHHVFTWEADTGAGTVTKTDIHSQEATCQSYSDFLGSIHENDAHLFKAAVAFAPQQKRRRFELSLRISVNGAYQRHQIKGMACLHDAGFFATGLYYNEDTAGAQTSRLEYLEKRDVLTGLVNSQTLDALFADTAKYGMYPQTLVVADIDRFKDINDTLGYHAGNTLIKNVASVLEECFAGAEMVARIGGGQYCAVYAGEGLLEIDNKIKEARMMLHGMYLNLIKAEVSFGYAVADQDSDFCTLYGQAMRIIKRSRNARKVLASCSVIDSLNSIIEAKVGWGKRQTRLQSLSTHIARILGCDEECIDMVKVLAKIVDIGLIGIDEQLLKKRASLTGPEREQYDNHVEIGRGIISCVDEVADLEDLYLDIFKRYDEWHDAIELPSRILAGVIGFDDIVSSCPAVSFRDIKDRFTQKSESEYCPGVVSAILSVAGKHYV